MSGSPARLTADFGVKKKQKRKNGADFQAATEKQELVYSAKISCRIFSNI